MTHEQYKDLFVRQKESFLEKYPEPAERMKYLIEFIVEEEKLCQEEFTKRRARISAAMSLLSDDESRGRLARRMKESKVVYRGDGYSKGEIPLDKEEKERKGSDKNVVKAAVLATMKLPGFTAEKIHGMLKNKYKDLTIEQVNEFMGKKS